MLILRIWLWDHSAMEVRGECLETTTGHAQEEHKHNLHASSEVDLLIVPQVTRLFPQNLQ